MNTARRGSVWAPPRAIAGPSWPRLPGGPRSRRRPGGRAFGVREDGRQESAQVLQQVAEGGGGRTQPLPPEERPPLAGLLSCERRGQPGRDLGGPCGAAPL